MPTSVTNPANFFQPRFWPVPVTRCRTFSLAYQRSSAVNFLSLPLEQKTPPRSTLCHRRRVRKPLGCAVGEQRMPQIHRITILVPLAVGACVVACTIFIHALAVGATVSFFRYEKKLGRMGAGFWSDVAIVALAMSIVLLAHLMEIALWAELFVICGEFQEFGTAYYHSAVNYTTLGYGDLIMTPSWRLLGPLEAANGMLLFGVSTAIIFAVVQRLIQARFADLRG
jgi:hypothetical protein